MSGELDNNEWLIRELELYECAQNWGYCSDLAMRAATALHLAEDVVEAKDAENERLRDERDVYRNAQISTERGYHAERALADQLAEALEGLRRAVIYSSTCHIPREELAAADSALAAYEDRRER